MFNKLEVIKPQLAFVNLYRQLLCWVVLLNAEFSAYCSPCNRKFSVGLRGYYYSLDRIVGLFT